MGTVNSSSDSNEEPGVAESTNEPMYHNVTVSPAHFKVITINQAYYANRLDITYEVRLGPPHQNGELLYESTFTYNHHILNQDVLQYILMDYVRHGNGLVAGIGNLEEFRTCVRLYLFRPRFDLSPAEKKGLIPIRCFHGAG